MNGSSTLDYGQCAITDPVLATLLEANSGTCRRPSRVLPVKGFFTSWDKWMIFGAFTISYVSRVQR